MNCWLMDGADWMNDEEYWQCIGRRAAEGQHELSMFVRRMLYANAPELVSLLDFHDDEPFLEPTFIGFFQANQKPRATFAQLLFGFLDEEKRPRVIDVVTSTDGVVYLPKLGLLKTHAKGCELSLATTRDPAGFILRKGEQVIDFVFQPSVLIPGTSLELYQSCPPGFERLFQDAEGRAVPFDIETITQQKRGLVEEACALIERSHPAFYQMMLSHLRGLCVYQASSPYSFANLGAHGVSFLNTSPNASVVFFVEDIVHQSSHVIFNAATLRRTDVFAIDPETKLSEVSDLDDYHGNVYEAFHGLFTQTNINECLRACLGLGIFSGRQEHELHGRISDDMKRFVTAVHGLGQRSFYTDLGWELYCYFKHKLVTLYAEQRALIERYDTMNQPYIFQYELFLERNPLPNPVGAI